jgi:hypothetical protein
MIAAAAAAIFAGGSAYAAPADQEFGRICVAARSVVEAVANARAAGFVSAPAEIRARATGLPSNGEILWRAEEGRMLLFVAGTEVRTPSGSSATMSGDLCVVAAAPTQADLKVKVESLLAVGREQQVGATPGFVYEQTDAGRVRVDAGDKAVVGVKAVQGSLRIASVIERNGLNGAVLMIPRISAK